MVTPRHWDDVYDSRPIQKVSWYEPNPATSLRLVREAAPDLGTPILDVGGGASLLVDRLLDAGSVDLTVLDISQTALGKATARLGDRAQHVSLVCKNVLAWSPTRRYGVWHDRAVFHFLVDEREEHVTPQGGRQPFTGVVLRRM